MKRLVIATAAFLACVVFPAAGQSSDPNTLAGATPQANVRGGKLRARAPGLWVEAAIARHQGFIGDRVNGPRSGQMPELAGASASSGSTSGSTAGSTSGGLLDSLISQFGGSLGSLGSLAGLTGLGGLGGSGTSTSGSGYTLEDLIAMRDAYNASNGDSSGSGSKTDANKTSTTQTNAAATSPIQQNYNFGGAIARLPKAEDRFQSTTTTSTTDQKFVDRLLQSWAQTFFTAMTVGFQSTDFINTLKDALRPLFLPPANQDSSSNNNSNNSNNSNNNGNGIEDLPSDNGDGDGTSSL